MWHCRLHVAIVPTSWATQGSDLWHRQPGFVEITCPHAGAFQRFADFLKTAKLLNMAAERVASGTATKSALTKLEVASGFRTNPLGLAMSTALEGHLEVPECINYDWVHSALQQGVLNCEVEALLSTTEVPREDLQTFLADKAWEFPGARRATARHLHKVFDARRVSDKTPEKIKASCSELLGLYGMLRCYFNLRLANDPGFAPHLASLKDLCSSLDIILDFKYGVRSIDAASVGELQALMGQHLTHHIAVYGDEYVRPKHHWLLDCPQQFLRDGLVLDAFVIERGHLEIKMVAEQVANTRCYERSVLTGVLTTTLRDNRAGKRYGLLGQRAVVPGGGFIVADRAKVHGIEFVVGDVIVHNHTVGLLKACALAADDLFFLSEAHRLVSRDVPCCGTYEPLGGLVSWDARAVCHALAWRRRPDGSIFVVCR